MLSFSTSTNKNSFIHNLNPSLKLIWTILLIVIVFLPTGFFGKIILIFIVSALWILAKLSWKLMQSIIISCLVMLVILFLVNWIAFKQPALVGGVENFTFIFKTSDTHFSHLISFDGHQFVYDDLWGGEIKDQIFNERQKDLENLFYKYVSVEVSGKMYYLYFKSYWYSLTSTVLLNSIYITLKIFLMITLVTIAISTTTTVQLTFAIEDILKPLKYLKVPVNEWSMTIAIAIRFVPSLLEESQKILKAQASRGVDFSYGNLKDKVKALVSLVVPMFSVAFNKANDLANAMEARAYNPRFSRTKYRNYSISVTDWVIFLFLSLIFGFFLLWSINQVLFAPFGTWEICLLK